MSLINYNSSSLVTHHNLYFVITELVSIHHNQEICQQVDIPSDPELKNYKNLKHILELFKRGEGREFQEALYKRWGYCERLFSQESWDEWTEYRTVLGRVAAYDEEYRVSPSHALLRRMRPLYKQAEKEAGIYAKSEECFRRVALLPEQNNTISTDVVGPFIPDVSTDYPCWRLDMNRVSEILHESFDLDRYVTLPRIASSQPFELLRNLMILFSEDKTERVEQITLFRNTYNGKGKAAYLIHHIPADQTHSYYRLLEKQIFRPHIRNEQIVFEYVTRLNSDLYEGQHNAHALIKKLQSFYDEQVDQSLFNFNR